MGNYKKLREEARQVFDALPYPTWKRMGYTEYNEPVISAKEVTPLVDSALELLGIEEFEAAKESKAQEFWVNFSDKKYGVDPKFVKFAECFADYTRVYYLGKNEVVDTPIRLQFDLSNYDTMCDQHLIYAEKGAEATIVLEYTAKDNLVADASQFHIGLVKVIAKENANVKVFVVQTLPKSKVHIYNAVAECQRDAKVSFYSASFGGDVVASDYRSFLEGDNSASNIEAIYIGQDQNRLDLSYNIQHYGVMTDSNIEVNGALSGSVKKVFRGDLYFHRGSRASTGREAEFVILLDEKVRCDSIPALFCDEDDVSGEHAANAGSIDENKLFYLMNRGLSEIEAKKLIIRASFSGVIDQLPIEEIAERLEKELEGKLLHV